MTETTTNHRRPHRFRGVKRLLVGRPVSSHEELHHRLNKRIGLAVFSSDALSSSAYATDEIMLALILAGSGAISLAVPIALVVTFVLVIVIISYRQTVRAYPSGGGAYIVAHENLGAGAGLTAASALMVDYVLTVAVSVAAGVAAIGAFWPFFRDNRVVITLAIVALITIANLRGLKESGTVFAVPTYGFIFAVGAMIVVGAIRFTFGHPTVIEPQSIPAVQELSLLLILRAFASGTTALTGVEAISNGVPAFRPPESKNASHTLAILGCLLAFLFVGITFLAHASHVDAGLIEEGKTVTSQIAGVVFGEKTLMFFLVQTFTALILVIAANTAYADFPRLGAILARDKYLPRVLQSRGDKLAFSNGIIFLALAAAGILLRYQADVHRIIPLYVVGVFTSFTLSQSGMVVHWFKLKTRGWRRSAIVNGFGALTTFVVLIVVARTKFLLGAWQVVLLIPVVAAFFWRVNKHNLRLEKSLKIVGALGDQRITANRVVTLVSPFAGGTLRAFAYAKSIGAVETRAVAFRVPESRLRTVRQRWEELGIETRIEPTGHRFDDLVEYVSGLEPSETQPVTIVLADPQYANWFEQLRKNFLLLRIKRRLMYMRGVIVTSVPFSPDLEPDVDRVKLPARLSLIVVVARVDRTSIWALDYAKSLNPAELTAMTICTDKEDGARILEQWEEYGIDVPLEIVDSPYRDVVGPIVREVTALRPNAEDAVGVVVPEFVATRVWQHLLHNEPQTAFLIKSALLFEPNVTVIDMPYRVDRESEEADQRLEIRRLAG